MATSEVIKFGSKFWVIYKLLSTQITLELNYFGVQWLKEIIYKYYICFTIVLWLLSFHT